jgi:4-oxalocrotonate tautomerase family enzyme
MPFVNVKLVDGVFTPEEKHAMAKAITDVMVKFEGSEAFREVVWVLIEELHTDGWHIGCHPFGDLQVVQPLPAGAPTAFATDLLLAFEKLSLNYLTAFLADPAYLEPGTKMPNLNLDQTQIDQVRQIALLIKQAIDGENLQPVHVYYELEKAAKP